MHFSDEVLQILARHRGEENLSGRKDLEVKVAALLLLVLRTGRGRPSLLQWVQRALRDVAPAGQQGRPLDPEWAAPRLARLLCAQLLRRIGARHDGAASRETVVAH